MPKYTVKSPLNHDCKEHAVGAPVELDEKTAAPLLAVGAVEPEATPSVPSGPTDTTERLEAIKSAIAGFDKNDASLWTKGGHPNLDALEKSLDWRPTAAERDRAWQELKPNTTE